jgi:RNA polymerase sigma-70 factor (ECF subfamily)
MATAVISHGSALPGADFRKAGETMNGQHSAGATKDLENEGTYTVQGRADEDYLLVAEARSGNRDAFGILFERHRSKAHRIAFRILRNDHDAEDAVQRSFQRAFVNLSRFRLESSFSTWMTRIAINEALMMLRQRRTNTAHSGNDTDAAHGLLDERPTPEQSLAQTELRSSVSDAISKLRQSLRVVIDLREIQGLTSAETARRLGLTVSAVKARVFHAKRHLRRHFEPKCRRGVLAS